MPRVAVVRRTEIIKSGRVLQLEGMFDVPAATHSESTWDVTIPIDERPWSIGLIVGASGSGKSTIARALFGDDVIERFDWPDRASVVDGFPDDMSIGDITEGGGAASTCGHVPLCGPASRPRGGPRVVD